jgi:hypothetical protein
MPFYTYRQNNSGGSFSAPAVVVIVSAPSAAQANVAAQDVGVYFDEDFEIDCECCGTRWDELDDAWDKGFATFEDACEDVGLSRMAKHRELYGDIIPVMLIKVETEDA